MSRTTDDSAGRVFRQRSTVDALRLYLELSDELISDMRAKQLLTTNDIEVITRLPSPSNRHELLQLLIRKPWTAAKLETFCSVLRRSSSLNRSLADKLQNASTSQVNDSWSTETADQGIKQKQDDVDLSSSLDSLLEPLPVEDRCTIQIMVRNKDQCIERVTRQKDRLQNDLQRCKNELEDARIKMQLTDRQLNEWLAGLHVSTTDESLRQALEDVKNNMTSQTDRIWQLENENRELKATCLDLNDTLKAESENKARLAKQLDEARERIATGQREIDLLEREMAGVRDEMAKDRESSVRTESQAPVEENSTNDVDGKTGKAENGKPKKAGGKHHPHHHHLQTARSMDSGKHSDPAVKNSKSTKTRADDATEVSKHGPAQKPKRRTSDTTPPWRAGQPNLKTSTAAAGPINTPRHITRRASITVLPTSRSWKNHADE